jgi:hypothetical protein
VAAGLELVNGSLNDKIGVLSAEDDKEDSSDAESSGMSSFLGK